jgi:hypothetical protein
MFERYSERARRAIFFARYEASNYGSQYIESEHLLLGLLREGWRNTLHLIPKLAPPDRIREEIERQIIRGERISTSGEVPLSKECKQAITVAAEEAKRYGHPYVEIEHLFLALLRVEESLAARILFNHEAKIENVRAGLKRIPASARMTPGTEMSTSPVVYASPGAPEAAAMLESFLRKLRAGLKDETVEFLAASTQFIDACGKRWAGEENFHKKVGELFAPFAARNARFVIEETTQPRDGLCIATLLWEGVPLPAKTPKGLCRMVVGLGRGEEESSEWSIYSVQVTPVTRA